MADLRDAMVWALGFKFSEQEYEYATVLTLKILDKKCKMNDEDQALFMAVYDGMGLQENSPFTSELHQVIAAAREKNPLVPSDEYKTAIHEKCKDAVATMEKPKMKAYKAFVRSFLDNGEACGFNNSALLEK